MAYQADDDDDDEPCKCPSVAYRTLPGDMYLAAKNGDVKKVRQYLENGNDINAADGDGYTLFSSACVGGQVSLVRYLHKQMYLHRNIRDWAGDTPLIHAAMMGHADVVKELISTPHQCRLDVNVRNNYDETALDLAAANEHPDVERLLQNVQLPPKPAPGDLMQECVPVRSKWLQEVKPECEVCLEGFDNAERRPRSLSCGHSLCTSCVTETIVRGPLKCPFCRVIHVQNAHVRTATDVPVNYGLDSLIQQYMHTYST